MADINIKYSFEFKDQNRQEVIELQLDSQTMEPVSRPGYEYDDWVRLERNQCPNCPLDIGKHAYCPVAASLSIVIEKFNDVTSHDEVELEVFTVDRTILQSTTAQRAISSLSGLLIATSGCPITSFLKPMARFHLPLATEEETIYRASGSYLLAQYFLAKKGKPVDLDLSGLKKKYHDMHVMNAAIAARVRSATQADSSVNAVILLDMFTNLMPYVIEDHLNDIRHLYDSYL